MQDADAIVVGAGPAGAAFSAFLGAERRRVALLDSAAFPRDKPCGEGVLPGGVAVLQELGVLDRLEAAGAQRILGVSYSRAGALPVRASFPDASSASGRPAYGLGVRRCLLDDILFQRAVRSASGGGVRPFERHKVIALQRSGGVWQVQTADGGRFAAPLLVAADGYRSTVRRLLGLQQRHIGRRFGIVGHFRLPAGRRASLGDDVRVTLRPGCESYFCPVGPNEVLVGILSGREMTRPLAGDPLAGYCRLVQSDPVLGPALTAAGAEPQPQVRVAGPFPAFATRVYGDGLLLIGDAAGFRDPVTGEGLARSLLSARLAANVAGEAFASGSLSAERLAPYAAGLAELTRDTDRLTRLGLLLTKSPLFAATALRGARRDAGLLPRLLGINSGAWGFERLSPRDWLALLAGV